MDNPIRLHWLDPRDPLQPFPPPQRAMRDPNGLLAIGGDLSAERLLRAYTAGIFPWNNPDEPILWWCPDPRTVLFPKDFHVSRSLQKQLNKGDFALSFNLAFARVMLACAAPRTLGHGTWLGSDMQQAYLELHRRGHAQSVEVWQYGELVGGVYGVSIGRVFFGESMFSVMENGSKIALHFLCRHLTDWGYELMDCQVASPHLTRLGAVETPREEFLCQLRKATVQAGRAGLWQAAGGSPDASRHLPS